MAPPEIPRQYLMSGRTTRYRHGTVVTDDFTGVAANYAGVSLRPVREAWLFSTEMPRPP